MHVIRSIQRNFSFVVPFIKLLKPRVNALVVFTGFVAVLCSSGTMHPFTCFVYLLSLALGSGAAGAINMWYESDIDGVMGRSAMRPIPSGAVSPDSALDFALVTGFFAVFMMAMSTNFLAAILFAFSISYYVFVYTFWLKRRSIHSTLLGGLATSLTPMISSLAVDSTINLPSIVLFLLIFFWSPPHFFALALANLDDYKKTGIPVMPCVRGVLYTKYNILFFSIIVSVVAFLPYLFVKSPVFYGVVSTLFNVLWIFKSVKVFFSTNKSVYRSFFLYSIVYLFCIFTAVMVFTLF